MLMKEWRKPSGCGEWLLALQSGGFLMCVRLQKASSILTGLTMVGGRQGYGAALRYMVRGLCFAAWVCISW